MDAPINSCIYSSPLGDIVLREMHGKLFNACFADAKIPLGNSSPETPLLWQAVRWLDTYFSGRNPGGIPAVQLQGTSFRQMVWRLLLEIPYGHTVSYKDIALELVRRNGLRQMSAQAVGGAVSHNPLIIFIPCHRVIGTDGRLTGYSGGLERKARLLRLEHSITHCLSSCCQMPLL